jgi:Tfp pilus assembly protein PilF
LDFDPEALLSLLSRLEQLRAPTHVVQRARLAAAVALRHRQRWREARALMLDIEEAQLRAATERSPNNARAWNALAVFTKDRRGDFDEAERCYRRAVELAPDDPIILNNLGLFLTRCRGMNDEAEVLLRRAVELRPNDANLLSVLGFLLQHERNSPEQAEPLFQRSLEIAPNEASVTANVAGLRLLQGRSADALALIGRSLQAEAESEITVRALFLGAVAARLDNGSAASWLARLRRLLARGIRGTAWHPRALMAELPKRLAAEDARLFAALQAFLFPLSGRTVEAQELEQFEQWRSAVGAEVDAV